MGLNDIRRNGHDNGHGPSANGHAGNGERHIDTTRYEGIVHQLGKPAQAKLWDSLTKGQWGCLALNIVRLYELVDDKRGNELLELVQANMAPRTPNYDGSRGRKWSLGSYGHDGSWVKLTDGSAVHFQDIEGGLVMTAWLWGYFQGRRDMRSSEALRAVTLDGVYVQDVVDYLDGLDMDAYAPPVDPEGNPIDGDDDDLPY